MQESLALRHGSPGGNRMGRTLVTFTAGMLLGVFLTLQLLSYMRIKGVSSRNSPNHETLILPHPSIPDANLLRLPSTPHTPKVAFMFLTVGPLPLGPLWENFFRTGNPNHYTIYIHSLPSYIPDHPASSVFFNRHIPSQPSKWGDISMCDAERRLLAYALLDESNTRFVLLSESCAPLRNFTFTYHYLVNSAQSFVGVFDDPSPVGRGRYDPGMMPEVAIDQWRKGAQWVEVSRELAAFIVADVRYYEKFREFCQPECYVDEHYIPTMLWIEFEAQVAMRSVTAVDWSKGGSHPGEFGEDEAAAFWTSIRADHGCVWNGESGRECYLFARKFLPSSLEPLLALVP